MWACARLRKFPREHFVHADPAELGDANYDLRGDRTVTVGDVAQVVAVESEGAAKRRPRLTLWVEKVEGCPNVKDLLRR
jgi:hypothetical protein